MDRRGDLAFFLSRTIDIVFSVIIILAVVAISMAIWSATQQEEKRAEKQYELLGDIVQGMVESSSEGITARREVSFPFSEENEFKGTIFFRSNDGWWTTPLPPPSWYTPTDAAKPATFAATINTLVYSETAPIQLPSMVARYCPQFSSLAKPGEGCICLSDVALKTEQDIPKALQGIRDCRGYDLPKGKQFLIFDFEKLQDLNVAEGDVETTPTVRLQKRVGGCDDTFKKSASAKTFRTPENSICILGALRSVDLPS